MDDWLELPEGSTPTRIRRMGNRASGPAGREEGALDHRVTVFLDLVEDDESPRTGVGEITVGVRWTELEGSLPGGSVVDGKDQPASGPIVSADDDPVFEQEKVGADTPIGDLSRRRPGLPKIPGPCAIEWRREERSCPWISSARSHHAQKIAIGGLDKIRFPESLLGDGGPHPQRECVLGLVAELGAGMA